MTVERTRPDGWHEVVIAEGDLSLTAIPGKGGDIISIQWRGLEFLWRSPWGLRARGSLSVPGSSEALLMEAYPGGWQSLFPHVGPSQTIHGVDWGMHGEVWTAPFEWKRLPSGIELSTTLVRSPFRITRQLSVQNGSVLASESATNEGTEIIDVAWGQHPAFGGSFLDETLEVIPVASDPQQPICLTSVTQNGHAITNAWPKGAQWDGSSADFTHPLAAGSQQSRLGSMSGLRGIQLVNHALRTSLDLRWSTEVMPYAWYWNESGGRRGFPWFGRANVLAIEPMSSPVDRPVHSVRFLPGETKEAFVSVTPQSLVETGRSEQASDCPVDEH